MNERNMFFFSFLTRALYRLHYSIINIKMLRPKFLWGLLCTSHLSPGRNVALKQETNQSSHYTSTGVPDSYRAEYAVDGRTGEGGNVSVIQHTCTHTRSSKGPGWWTVTFSQPVDITWFLIYNRPGKKTN